MTELLTFPGLGLSFELSRVAFWLGSFPIYWYGLTFAAAFLLGLGYFYSASRKVGIHPDQGLDPLLMAIIGGVIGARVYFVIFQWDALYKDNPMKVFAFREGGLAIYGGVIGAILVGAIACRIKKIPLFPMLDVGLPALLLGQAVGRWGNFFNIEAFGCNTSLPWGMTSNSIQNYLSNPTVVSELNKLGQVVDPTMPVHPTFFYEFIWNLLGFLLLAFVLTPRRRYDGQVTLSYIVWYGLGRFFIEGLRTDSLVTEMPWGTIRVSQYLAILGCIAALALMVYLGIKARHDNRPAWLGLYADTDISRGRMQAADDELAELKEKRKQKRAEKKAKPAEEPEEEIVPIIIRREPTAEAIEQVQDSEEQGDSDGEGE
ncbi:MAG: prolipoprotein diacylglyceryl transferase [Angelakisella sp.]